MVGADARGTDEQTVFLDVPKTIRLVLELLEHRFGYLSTFAVDPEGLLRKCFALEEIFQTIVGNTGKGVWSQKAQTC